MKEIRIPRLLMRAVTRRRPLWYLPLIIGIVSIAISFSFGEDSTSKYQNLFMSVGGWLLTLTGILFAGNHAARIALADTFSKLYERESSTEQYYAKKLVCEFARKIIDKDNRYLAARELLGRYSKKKQAQIHEARRKLRHFWLLAEAYFESGLMTSIEVFAVAGSPEILLYLEPLEVIAAESVEYPIKSCAWTSINLLNKWYRLTKQKKKRLKKTLPLDKELYKKSIGEKSA